MNKYIEVQNNPSAKACNADYGFDGDLKILIAGNSFSRDSLFYLRKIAAAHGIDITMGLLYMGGRYLAAAVWFCILTAADARTLDFVPGKSVLGCWVTNGDEGYYLFGDFCRVDERYVDLLNNVVYNTLKGLGFYESDTCK